MQLGLNKQLQRHEIKSYTHKIKIKLVKNAAISCSDNNRHSLWVCSPSSFILSLFASEVQRHY